MVTPDDLALRQLEKRIAQRPRQAILWTRSGIPSADVECTSYFGGLPRLPPNLEWPRVTITSPVDSSRFQGSPTFLGQLDFADISAFARAQRLPTKGVLYFFCATSFVDGEPEHRVLYAPEGCLDQPERAPPVDLMRLSGDAYCSGRDWRGDDEAWSKVDFRYSVKPHIFNSYRTWPNWPDEEEHQYRAAYDRVQVAALEKIFGPVARFESSEQQNRDDLNDWPRLLFPSWPMSRVFYEEFRRALERELEGGGLYEPPTAGSPPKSIEFYEQTKAGLAHWSTELSGRDMTASLPDNLRQDIRNWFLSVRARAHDLQYGAEKAPALPPWNFSAARDQSMWLAANMTMAECAASGSDEETIRAALTERAQGWRSPIFSFDPDRPVGIRDIPFPMHQTLGYGEQCQSAAEDHVDDVLLLQIAPECLGWQGRFSEMLLQFWIKPADLAAKRFDRVEMTAECS